jgi:hypothetical protein
MGLPEILFRLNARQADEGALWLLNCNPRTTEETRFNPNSMFD